VLLQMKLTRLGARSNAIASPVTLTFIIRVWSGTFRLFSSFNSVVHVNKSVVAECRTTQQKKHTHVPPYTSSLSLVPFAEKGHPVALLVFASLELGLPLYLILQTFLICRDVEGGLDVRRWYKEAGRDVRGWQVDNQEPSNMIFYTCCSTDLMLQGPLFRYTTSILHPS
jgi:hypothetical protein